MLEMAESGKDHGYFSAVTGADHGFVLDRAAGLNDRPDTVLLGERDRIWFRKETVRRKHRAAGARPGLAKRREAGVDA